MIRSGDSADNEWTGKPRTVVLPRVSFASQAVKVVIDRGAPSEVAAVDAHPDWSRPWTEALLALLTPQLVWPALRRENEEPVLRRRGESLGAVGALLAHAPLQGDEQARLWAALERARTDEYIQIRRGAWQGLLLAMESDDRSVAHGARARLWVVEPRDVCRSGVRHMVMRLPALLEDARWRAGVAECAATDPGLATSFWRHFTRAELGRVLEGMPAWPKGRAVEFLGTVLPSVGASLTDAELLALATHPEEAVRLQAVLLPARRGGRSGPGR